MPAIILAESGCSGRREMSSFQGLSGGKICIAARILSASGVLNITGFVIGGSFDRSPPSTVIATRRTRGENQCMDSCFYSGETQGSLRPCSTFILASALFVVRWLDTALDVGRNRILG